MLCICKKKENYTVNVQYWRSYECSNALIYKDYGEKTVCLSCLIMFMLSYVDIASETWSWTSLTSSWRFDQNELSVTFRTRKPTSYNRLTSMTWRFFSGNPFLTASVFVSIRIWRTYITKVSKYRFHLHIPNSFLLRRIKPSSILRL